VIEHALTMYLGDRAFDEALAQRRSATTTLPGSREPVAETPHDAQHLSIFDSTASGRRRL
jgi:hypothetical protein